MKKTLLTLFNILIISFVFSQKNETLSYVSTAIRINVNEVDDVKKELNAFLSKNNIVTNNYSFNKTSLDLSLSTDSTGYYNLIEKIKSFGFIISENTTSNKSTNQVFIINQEIELLNKEKQQYENLTSKIDSTEQAKFFEYWEKIISIDKTISEKEMRLTMMNSAITNYTINVNFSEDEVVGSEYNDLWVNMPGLEFSILNTEQPKDGFSSEMMLGYNLKYLINRKKTYVILGLYKSQGKPLPAEINEMYIFALGQDFYSRKLGRGQRKFFNLYTSFNLGAYISSSELEKSNSWFVNPFIGLEIYKNKNILIDNKFGYFLPFQNNRNQRGLLYNVSLNFVF